MDYNFTGVLISSHRADRHIHTVVESNAKKKVRVNLSLNYNLTKNCMRVFATMLIHTTYRQRPFCAQFKIDAFLSWIFKRVEIRRAYRN